MTHPIDLLLKAGRNTNPIMGTVTNVDVSGYVDVNIGGGTVTASLTDQTRPHFISASGISGIGLSVALVRVGATFAVGWTLSGSAGGGGLLLGSNLVANPSFDFGTVHAADHWTGYGNGGQLAWNSTPGEALSGTACATVTLSEDLAATRSHTIASATFMVDDGTTYQGAGWVKTSTLDPSVVATFALLTGTSAANMTPGAQSTATSLLANVSSPGSAWQYAQGNATIPAGHTYARLLLTAAAAAGSAISLSWDDTGLRQVITT